MNLEIKSIFSTDLVENGLPDDLQNFNILITVGIGEKDKDGEEIFYFTAASYLGLQNEIGNSEFKFLRGYILMETFDWKIIRRALENLINHSRHLETWSEIVEFWKQYGNYAD